MEIEVKGHTSGLHTDDTEMVNLQYTDLAAYLIPPHKSKDGEDAKLVPYVVNQGGPGERKWNVHH